MARGLRVLRSILLSCLACVLAAACDTTPIRIRDEPVTSYDGRMLWQVKPPEEGKSQWFGVEVDGSAVEGDDTQGLAPGEVIDLHGVTFAGPSEVASDYRLEQVSLAAVFGDKFQEDAGVRLLIGTARQDLELELAQGATRVEDHEHWWGLLLGAEFTLEAKSWLSFDARGTWSVDLGDVETDMSVLEVGALLSPIRALGLFAGWRWVDYDQVNLGESDIDLRTDGPTLGLRASL